MLPNTKDTVLINGPSGHLEALINLPRGNQNIIGAAVICHPHPLKEGTMHNKVVHYLAKTFNNCGYASVRFNYRGVGQSEGGYGEGVGETDDALSIIDWTQSHLSTQQPIWLAGFSFGGYVALSSSTQRNIAGLITIAPAVNLLDFKSLTLPAIPWLMVHGDEDDIVPFQDAVDWYEALKSKPHLEIMDGAGHFFHGRLNELRDITTSFISKQQTKNTV